MPRFFSIFRKRGVTPTEHDDFWLDSPTMDSWRNSLLYVVMLKKEIYFVAKALTNQTRFISVRFNSKKSRVELSDQDGKAIASITARGGEFHPSHVEIITRLLPPERDVFVQYLLNVKMSFITPELKFR